MKVYMTDGSVDTYDEDHTAEVNDDKVLIVRGPAVALYNATVSYSPLVAAYPLVNVKKWTKE